MCGIAGFFGFNSYRPNEECLMGMLDSLRHRGPDGSGHFLRCETALGMTRLAIIDVAGGRQPLFNEDETIALVCNGEIYNHNELRRTLVSNGHQFRTRSDIEVLLHLYEDFGEDCFKHINGMFAAAIVDFRRTTLTLARDPFGQKPLYVHTNSNRVAFASELKALRQLPDVSSRIDERALLSFQCFRYVPHPRTIFKDFQKLTPGTSITFYKSGTVDTRRYYTAMPHAVEPELVADENGDATYRELRAAVARHLMSERPLGVYLSGGLDSSAIVSLMAELGVEKIRTYSIGCEGDSNSELTNARLVSSQFRTEHVEVTVTPDQFLSDLYESVSCIDEPMADLTAFFLYRLSKIARRDVVVVLSGEGSDEFLGGYGGTEDIQRHFDRRHLLRRWSTILKTLLRLPLAPELKHRLMKLTLNDSEYLQGAIWNSTSVFSLLEMKDFGVADMPLFDVYSQLRSFYRERPNSNGLLLFMAAQIEWWLPDDLLHKADRMSMANSIELRCPFLDMEFVKFCLSLRVKDRIDFRCPRYTRKIALKKAFKNRLPPQIAIQPKRGFPIMTGQWLTGPLREFMRDEFSRSSRLGSACFQKHALDEISRRASGGERRAQEQAWNILLLNVWGERSL